MSILSKMLRIAGRGDDGTAKAIATNNDGVLKTQLTGSTLSEEDSLYVRQGAKATVETVAEAVSVPAGGNITITFDGKKSNMVFLLISTDKQPWSTLASRGGWVQNPMLGMTSEGLFPVCNNRASTYGSTAPMSQIFIYRTHSDGVLGGNMNMDVLNVLRNIREEYGVRYENLHTTDVATVTLKILRVWRDA